MTRRGACDVIISACKQKKMADDGFSPGSSSGEEAPRLPIRYYKRSRGKCYTEDSSDEEESEEERVSRLGSNPLLQTGGSVVGASDRWVQPVHRRYSDGTCNTLTRCNVQW